MTILPEMIDGLPNICGNEALVAEAVSGKEPVFLNDSRIDFGAIKSAFGVALHMQQPLIPAGGDNLETAEVISNLKFMMDHPETGDNHNAFVFHDCYKRIGYIIPELVEQGKEPRVMLDYAGCLLYGLRKMGLDDVFDDLRRITCDPAYNRCVEWLGCAWSHAVAPSTSPQDMCLHVKAWQHHFAAIFGLEALSRVKGFSPAEMALPNHPDVFYEYVKTLKDCGYLWVMVQEHSVEDPETGHHSSYPHIPHRLVARNSKGEEVSILAMIKTQGSDTKLVAQMQPYYEAKCLDRAEVAGKRIPPMVIQIGDGENGGVMMNEFPSMFRKCAGEYTGTETPAMNVTEYLEHLFALGLQETDFPVLQPILQKRIWDRFENGAGPEKLEQLLEELKKEDGGFHMDGGSWTNSISWVSGYENVLEPMDQVSIKFAEKVLKANVPTSEPRFRNALFYLLVTQTSCYRYWGQGVWTDYARELCRRANAILDSEF